jgi:DNA-binding response OmpR family regulator
MKVRHKILIVDDEPHIRRLIRAALERADYAIVEAGNARAAIEQLREERPDITLLDLGLPDRDGLELVPLFKQQSETTLIARTVTKGGSEIHLTPKEYAVLAQLARFPGRVITHKQIMAEVWPREHEHHVEYLRVLIRTLRQKLEADPQQPRIISNELGIGYRLRLGAEKVGDAGA